MVPVVLVELLDRMLEYVVKRLFEFLDFILDLQVSVHEELFFYLGRLVRLASHHHVFEFVASVVHLD